MFLYTIAIRAYHFLVYLLAPFNKRAALFTRGRKGVFAQLESFRANNKKPLIWIHCASLGEFEQGRPLIEALKKNYPNYGILLSFFSPSGYEIQKKYDAVSQVCYLPADTPAKARRFIAITQPALCIFVKYEFWLNYLNCIQQQKIPALLISAIFRPSQHFFKWYGTPFRKSLKTYRYLFVQNQSSLQLLHQLGIQQCSVAGDTRFDRVLELARHPLSFPVIEKFIAGRKTIIAGSTWPEDEEVLMPVVSGLLKKQPEYCLIIAPHHIDERNITRVTNLIKKYGLTYTLYSNATDAVNKQVLVLNSMGMLSSVYQYGYLAFIGGGFSAGIHNILEALTFGLPVMFGPEHQKYQEAIDAIELGAALAVNNTKAMETALFRITSDAQLFHGMSKQAESYVKKNIGSTQKILDLINEQRILDEQH